MSQTDADYLVSPFTNTEWRKGKKGKSSNLISTRWNVPNEMKLIRTVMTVISLHSFGHHRKGWSQK